MDLNYIRNSVKVIVDAYNGTVDFYLTEMFVNGAGELDQKHDQDLRDTCVMLLDRAGCDLLTICDITGHSYRSAQTIVKHYRARKPTAPMPASTGSNCRYARKG